MIRAEISKSEQIEEEYWGERMEEGTYPCDECGEWGHTQKCEDCKNEV